MKLVPMMLALFSLSLSTSVFADYWKCEAACWMDGNSCGSFGAVWQNNNADSQEEGIANLKSMCQKEAGSRGCDWGKAQDFKCQYQRTAYDLIFKNECAKAKKIWTAVQFKDASNNWVANGFWGLAYGQTARVGTTRNRVFYYHGIAEDKSVSWNNNPTDYTAVNGERTPFNEVRIGDNALYGDFTFRFTCD